LAYAAYPQVVWSADWQETVAASLKTTLPAIVETIESAAAGLINKLKDANRQAEIERLRWQAEQERWRRDEDRRKVQQSIKESQEELGQIIEPWSRVMAVSRFLKGVEKQASGLADEVRRQELQQRLALARALLGTEDPLNFFLEWRAPSERYQSQYPDPIPEVERGDAGNRS
jgi:hypothetical protein